MGSDYNEDELVELSEEDFLEHGEPDPEFEHILHHDHRVFDFVTKDIGLINDAEKFCDEHNHLDLGEETLGVITDNLRKLMKEKDNPNI